MYVNYTLYLSKYKRHSMSQCNKENTFMNFLEPVKVYTIKDFVIQENCVISNNVMD